MHNKFRPKTLSEFIGNEEVISAVERLISLPYEDRLPTYFITGPFGLGKSSLAAILARELGATTNGLDLIKINASNDRGIETARKIEIEANTPSIIGTVKVFLLEEANQLTKEMSKALLDITEHPPKGVYFIFVTMNPENLNDALLSRGPLLQLRPLSREESLKLVKKVMKAEQITLTVSMVESLLEYAVGIPRLLLMGLNVIRGCKDVGEARKLLSQQESEQSPEVIDIARAIAKSMNPASYQSLLRQSYDDMKKNPEKYRIGIGGFFAKVAISPSNINAFEEMPKILQLFSEPLYGPSGHIKLLKGLIEAHCIMSNLRKGE